MDLGALHDIESINVFNRVDGTDRTRDCYVMISETPFTSNDLATTRSQANFEQYFPGQVGSPSTMNPQVQGRYVRVQLENTGFLVLGEVEVEGCIVNLGPNGNNTSTSFSINSEFLNFEAIKNQRKVQLQWITDMEPQNEFFIIEKSLDGQDFEYLMEVPSTSISSSPKFYLENDYVPQNGKNYYRLRQVLVDGSEILSPIYEVEFDLDDLVIFPNPAKQRVHINLKNFIGENAVIQIYDGRGVLHEQRELDEIENDLLEIDLNNYNNGLYMVSIKADGQKRIVEKLIIEKGD